MIKVFVCVCLLSSLLYGDIKVTTDFEGGSAKEITIDGNSVKFKPGGSGDRGFTCWWYMKLEGVQVLSPLKVTVDARGLKQSRNRNIGSFWAMPDALSYSYDNKTWHRSKNGRKNKSTATWTLTPAADKIWIAWGIPYVTSHSKALTERLKSDYCEPFILCKTREGRAAVALKVTNRNNKPKKAIWIQARQHAWESGSSWVGEGLIEWLCGDSEDAKQVRNKAVIYYVPIMDVDNVATGNGGKEQFPHDHNRDWSDRPHWNSVAAAQKIMMKHIDSGEMSLFVDLHNPGPTSKETFLFAAPLDIMSKSNQKAQKKFIRVFKENVKGPLPFKGLVKISGKSYHPLWKSISKSWFMIHSKGSSCGVTIEIPWNSPNSTQKGYKQTGAEIAQAIADYLK